MLLGAGLFCWIVYGSTFDGAASSAGGLLGWFVVRAAAFAALCGGAWLIASSRSQPRSRSRSR